MFGFIVDLVERRPKLFTPRFETLYDLITFLSTGIIAILLLISTWTTIIALGFVLLGFIDGQNFTHTFKRSSDVPMFIKPSPVFIPGSTFFKLNLYIKDVLIAH